MQDGLVKATLKFMMRMPYTALLGMARMVLKAKGEWVWELGGTCQGCGECCEAPGISAGILTWYVPPARKVFLWWQKHVNGFELLQERPGARAFIFRCTHFDAVTRRCDSYATRPGMCRDYPRLVLHGANPRFMDGCGHRAVLRSAPRLLNILDNEPMSDAQRELLKDRLRLK